MAPHQWPGRLRDGIAGGIPGAATTLARSAATRPPLGRRVPALHRGVEWLVIEGSGGVKRFDLSAASPCRRQHHPQPRRHPKASNASRACRWTFRLADLGITLTRELTLSRGSNQATVRYQIERPQALPPASRLPRTPPPAALRDFHALTQGQARYGARVLDDGSVELAGGAANLLLSIHPTARFVTDPQWWNNFEYARELERGQPGVEDLFSPGVYISECSTTGPTTIELRAWVPQPDEAEPLDKPNPKLSAASQAFAAQSPAHAQLLEAADQFIVRRAAVLGGTNLTSIIAGYPWFSDWGAKTRSSRCAGCSDYRPLQGSPRSPDRLLLPPAAAAFIPQLLRRWLGRARIQHG